jgi:hypothetical protein
MNEVTDNILNDQRERNRLIVSTYWFNPVTGFHHWLNQLTSTGHEANLKFRRKIQEAGESINRRLLLDEWRGQKMNKDLFDEYTKMFVAEGTKLSGTESDSMK